MLHWETERLSLWCNLYERQHGRHKSEEQTLNSWQTYVRSDTIMLLCGGRKCSTTCIFMSQFGWNMLYVCNILLPHTLDRKRLISCARTTTDNHQYLRWSAHQLHITSHFGCDMSLWHYDIVICALSTFSYTLDRICHMSVTNLYVTLWI